MTSLNRVTLIGNVGRDPEKRTTANGITIVKFDVATQEKWKNTSGKEMESTEWHKIVVFSGKNSAGLTGVVQDRVRSGCRVYIEGMIKTRKWQDKQGQDRYTTEVVVNSHGSKLIVFEKIHEAETTDAGYDFADDDMPF